MVEISDILQGNSHVVKLYYTNSNLNIYVILVKLVLCLFSNVLT